MTRKVTPGERLRKRWGMPGMCALSKDNMMKNQLLGGITPDENAQATPAERMAMNRWLIIGGVILILLGVAWPWISRIPWGHLPGDISFEREDFSLYFPLMTGLVLSIVISLLLWFFRK